MKKSLQDVKQNSSFSFLEEVKFLMDITDKILSKNQIVLQDYAWMERIWEWADAHKIEEEILYIIATSDRPEYGGGHYIFSFFNLFDSLYGNPEIAESISDAQNEYRCTQDNYSFEDFDKFYNLRTGILRNSKDFLSSKVLDISNKNLSSLPSELFQLENLEYLNLDDNKLIDLPKEINNLSHLKNLWINNNILQCLPESICKLNNLKLLSLHGNLELILTKKQKEWLLALKNNGCEVYIDDDLLNRTVNNVILKIDICEDETSF